MKEEEKCIPWFLPPVDPDARPCSPYETKRFKKEMESPDAKDCEVWQQIEKIVLLDRSWCHTLSMLLQGNAINIIFLALPAWLRGDSLLSQGIGCPFPPLRLSNHSSQPTMQPGYDG